jgi:sugar phosphate isomerase/epimerase
MRLACSIASFPQDRLEIALAKVQWAGFDAVELPLEAEPFPSEDEVRHRLRVNDLSLAAGFAGPLPSTANDVEALGRIGRAATFTRACDGPLIVLEAPEAIELSALAAMLRLLHRALGDLDLGLCLVNRRGTALEGTELFRALWQQGLPERIGVALDPAHAALAGWDPAEIDALPELPRHVYLNDLSAARVVPAGEGELELLRVISELRLRGYPGALSVQLENAEPWDVEPTARRIHEQAASWLHS